MKKLLTLLCLFICFISAFSQSRGEGAVSDIIPEGSYYVNYGHIEEWGHIPNDFSLVERYSLTFNSNSGTYSMVLNLIVPYRVESGLDVKLHVGNITTDLSYYTHTTDVYEGATGVTIPLTKSVIAKALDNSDSTTCTDSEQGCYCEAYLYIEDPNRGIYFLVYPTSREWFVESLNKINYLNSLHN